MGIGMDRGAGPPGPLFLSDDGVSLGCLPGLFKGMRPTAEPAASGRGRHRAMSRPPSGSACVETVSGTHDTVTLAPVKP